MLLFGTLIGNGPFAGNDLKPLRCPMVMAEGVFGHT